MRAQDHRSVDVAIIGGGLAGAAMATRVARRGHAVVVLERSPEWRWHACGVFASPAAIIELRSLGMDCRILDIVARPIPGMNVQTTRETTFRLDYGAGDAGGSSAVAFDRRALDEGLLDLAAEAGTEVLRGCTVESVELERDRTRSRLTVRGPGGVSEIRAHVVVGADGIRSLVARAAGVARPAPLGGRVGLTWHVADPVGDAVHDARMVVLDGAYCGLAPVPGGRINVGIVLSGRARLRDLASRGAASVGARILDETQGLPGGTLPGHGARTLDAIAGAAPLGHRVTRRAGEGWMLIGDAAGFLDPFTGEGINRALVSARLAAAALEQQSYPERDLSAYDRMMRARFLAKDVVSLVVQAFLARPLLFEYAARRLASRERLRDTMGMVMGDITPATRALDPRFIAALLAP